MYIDPFAYKTSQQYVEERIAEAQVCHAQQRRIKQQLSQALAWLGHHLITWSRRLQTKQQPWALQGEQTTG